MEEWKPITLGEGGAYAWQTVLTDHDQESTTQRPLVGLEVSLAVEDGKVDVFASLAPKTKFHPAKGRNGLSLTGLTAGLHHVAGPIHTLKVVGVGTVTVLAAQRR